MNRVFLSLYFVIVISVVVVGQGADKLWQVYNPEPEVGEFEKLFFSLLDSKFSGLTKKELDFALSKTSEEIGQKLSLYTLEDIAQSSLSERIAHGEIVTVFDKQGLKSSYKRIKNSDFIIRAHLNTKHLDQGRIYLVLLFAFYAGIAVIIYFWIWPLSRDLKKLTNYTQKVGVGVPGKVDLGQRSAVYTLAAAFNAMAERIHELLASHKEMTYAVSHELRTPLARMKFALEIAKDSKGLDGVKKQLVSVREDVAEMDTLINELLAYAGFEYRNERLKFSEGDLPSLLENLLVTNHTLQACSGITYCLDNRLPDNSVQCEWYLLERCMHNLIQNAFKYTRSKIHVTSELVDDCYRVTVEDDGPGIVQEDREKIFNAFVRLRNTVDENKSGFGLGLAIVSRIMKWHRGAVTVSSSELGGAKFIVCWPVLSGAL